MQKILIRGGIVVTGKDAHPSDVLVEDGIIQAVGSGLQSAGATEIDAGGCLVFPGGVDVHTHMPWPTGSHISTDTFASGTRAAVFGGVTTVLDFAIPDDHESLAGALQRKTEEAHREAWVDYSFHINIRGDAGRCLAEVPALVEAGFPSFKVFMAYEGFRLADADLLQVLEVVAKAGGLVNIHAENGPLADFLTQKLLNEGKRSLDFYPQARPPVCEEEAVGRLLAYQRETGVHLHIHHVSTAGAAAQIGAARRGGYPVSGETCPHYLVFTEQDYAGSATKAAGLICAPSIKSQADQQALWQALQEGALSAVATDHCPYTRAQKEAHLDDFSQVPGGMAGVETRLPLLYTFGVVAGRLSLPQFARVWAEEPARIFGLAPRKGAITPGSDADLVVFDPHQSWTLHARNLHMNTDCLAYEGMPVTGKCRLVMLRGKIIVEDQKIAVEKPCGHLIYRRLQ